MFYWKSRISVSLWKYFEKSETSRFGKLSIGLKGMEPLDWLQKIFGYVTNKTHHGYQSYKVDFLNEEEIEKCTKSFAIFFDIFDTKLNSNQLQIILDYLKKFWTKLFIIPLNENAVKCHMKCSILEQ